MKPAKHIHQPDKIKISETGDYYTWLCECEEAAGGNNIESSEELAELCKLVYENDRGDYWRS